jgi:hypothetical protein
MLNTTKIINMCTINDTCEQNIASHDNIIIEAKQKNIDKQNIILEYVKKSHIIKKMLSPTNDNYQNFFNSIDDIIIKTIDTMYNRDNRLEFIFGKLKTHVLISYSGSNCGSGFTIFTISPYDQSKHHVIKTVNSNYIEYNYKGHISHIDTTTNELTLLEPISREFNISPKLLIHLLITIIKEIETHEKLILVYND